jgi:membrane-bound serine protease (ClpP class)
VKWADDAVRSSVSLTEAEALEKNVIDIVADNENDLLAKLDGKEVQVNGVTKILQTKNATVEPLEM